MAVGIAYSRSQTCSIKMVVLKSYKIADHHFSVEVPDKSTLWSAMEESYGPFELFEQDGEGCFALVVVDKITCPKDRELLFTNEDSVQTGFVAISHFRLSDGSLYFELRHPNSVETNGCLHIEKDLSTAYLKLCGNSQEQWYVFNSAVQLCFMLSTIKHKTLLMHSSAVIYRGKAYLFLGKSGTGKSTHSAMWLKALEGVTLMNDDHPIVRMLDDGRAVAYGSPWSGKTRCYKNLKAPLGGVIRIVRAQYNRAVKLSTIHSYASLMTSCSGIVWDREFADYRDSALQAIVAHTPCWTMEALADEDAAIVCSTAVAGE